MIFRNIITLIFFGFASWLVQGCTSFSPPRKSDSSFLERIETQQSGSVEVSAVVLSDREGDEFFAARMARHKIQPVWIEIENRGDVRLRLMLLGIDNEYFSPSEAAWRTRRLLEGRSQQKMECFIDRHIPLIVPPRQKVAGFAFTNRDPGAKAFSVQLIGSKQIYHFDFNQRVPGLNTDFEQSPASDLYRGEELPDLSLEHLKAYLEKLPATVLGGDRKSPGDPLNLVIIGKGPSIRASLIRRGWDLTELVKFHSVWRMVTSSLLKSPYRTSPVSPLYFFGRPHDFALQKARGSVNARNHLRLWRAPVNHEGVPVWVGQISRDIGVKLTTRTVVTHKVDPNVDDARTYLMMDLISSTSVNRVGFVKGAHPADWESPNFNYTDDPYITDGLRVVFFLGRQPTDLDEIDWLGWEKPHLPYPGMERADLAP